MKKLIVLSMTLLLNVAPLQAQVGVGIEFFTLDAKLDFNGLDTVMGSSGLELRGNMPADLTMSITNPMTSPINKIYRLEIDGMYPGDTSQMNIPPDVSFLIEYPTTNPPFPGKVTIEWSSTIGPLATEKRKVHGMSWGPYGNEESQQFTVTPVSGGQTMTIDYIQYFVDTFLTVDLPGTSVGASYIPLVSGQPGWDSLDVITYDGEYSLFRKDIQQGFVLIAPFQVNIPAGSLVKRLIRDPDLVTSLTPTIDSKPSCIVQNETEGIQLESIDYSTVRVLDMNGRFIQEISLEPGIPQRIRLTNGLYILHRLDKLSPPMKILRW